MEQELLQIGSQALKAAALNEEAKAFLLENPKLFSVLKKAANRYIAGEEIEETLHAIQQINEQGFSVTTDYMGESIRNEAAANQATGEFIKFAKASAANGLNTSLSLDLSHIGSMVSNQLAAQNLRAICEVAAQHNQQVILSMEGVDRTETIIELYKNTVVDFPNLGITLQAYLYRTQADLDALLELPGSIRLVKGAYAAPADLALPRGEELDQVYLKYVEQLFAKDHKCSIASHDEKIHQAATQLVKRHQPKNYCFERLLGIRNEELKDYLAQGHPCRIYVVYGKEWYLYLCNRWAEYPLNIFRGLADIVN